MHDQTKQPRIIVQQGSILGEKQLPEGTYIEVKAGAPRPTLIGELLFVEAGSISHAPADLTVIEMRPGSMAPVLADA